MQNKIAAYWPAIAISLLVCITVAIFYTLILHQTQGYFSYALDDAYIHMAIAKNLSQHGVWGVTRYEFSSTSSSPLWTLLLAAVFRVVGPNDISPLLMNLIMAALLFVIVNRVLVKAGLKPSYIFLILLGIAYFTPMPVLIFTGMEHVVHALLTIISIYLAAQALTGADKNATKSAARSLLLLAPFLTATRYEGFFLIMVIGILFLLRKKWKYALLLGLTAWAPQIIFGFISVAKGWYWLPNTLLLKGNLPQGNSFDGLIKFLNYGLLQLWGVKRISLLFIVCIALYMSRFIKYKHFWEFNQIMLLIYIVITVMHMMLAKTGWFYRYEAYLIAVSLFVSAYAVWVYFPSLSDLFLGKGGSVKGIMVLMAILIVGALLSVNRYKAISEIPRASKNIFEHQVQMGRFLQEYYQGASVALDDIGATNYFADLHCLDLYGLASLEVCRAKLASNYDTNVIDSLAHAKNITVAILHPYYYLRNSGGLPSWWRKVGSWSLKSEYFFGQNVTFFALDSTQAKILEDHLQQFSKQLPTGVDQAGY